MKPTTDTDLLITQERARLRAILALVAKWEANLSKSRGADYTGFEAGQTFRLRECVDEIKRTRSA